MARRTLVDYFSDLSATPGEFLVYDDGYRTRAFSYAEAAAEEPAPAAAAPEESTPEESTPEESTPEA